MGLSTSDDVQIVSTIVEFFSNLYSKADVWGWGIERVEWCPIDGESGLELKRLYQRMRLKVDFEKAHDNVVRAFWVLFN